MADRLAGRHLPQTKQSHSGARSVGGSPSGQPIAGVVCPPCAHAIEHAGSVGQTAMGPAVLAHRGQSQQQLSATELIGLRAWAVVSPSIPSLKQWDHTDLQRVRDELGI